MALLYCLGLGVSIPALHPCCYTIYDHKIWLTYYLEEKTWYAHVDLALNTISLAIMIFCYASILLKVRKSHLSTRRHRLPGTGSSNQNNQHPAVTVHRSANQPPSRREMNLFVQFFVVSAVFLATFLTWQVLGNFQISTSPWLYFTTTSFFFINNAINPTVYLIYNSGLRREVDNMICWWFGDRCRPKNSGHQQTTPSSDKEPIQPALVVHRESILLVSGVQTTTPLLSYKNALL
uniref:G-protein coupled receptors family 1 profile domain-containing protein n=1 Tax=Romanomermis culicivorax TaxID=13658 RepID=A0A915L8F9_ROMCU